jgi:perosamine synthetase
MPSDFIPLSAPHLNGNEWKYVKDCLDTGWVSSVGGYVDRFERELAARVGAPAAVACSSGTAALHVALLLAGVQKDDEVVLPTLTFIAPVNVVTYLGAHPVLIDAEPTYYQLDPAKLASFLTQGCKVEGGALRNRATGRRVAAIVPVHVLGHSCDMDPILELARRLGLKVIEDATESLGSSYKGRPTGMLGDLGCFSFNGNKLITTGSGGMIVAADPVLLARARYLTTQAKDDAVEFVHNEIGFNYRLSNVSAAVGVAQLEQLDRYLQRKREIAQRYDAALGGLPGIALHARAPWCESNLWLYTIRVDPARFGLASRELLRSLHAQRIETRPLWQPMHRSPAHAGAFAWQCEVADALNAQCLSLPCSVGLSDADQARVIAAIVRAGR